MERKGVKLEENGMRRLLLAREKRTRLRSALRLNRLLAALEQLRLNMHMGKTEEETCIRAPHLAVLLQPSL